MVWPAHGRSPRGRVETSRAGVLVTPWLALVSLTIGGRRFDGQFINPVSLTELAPVVPPLFLGSVVVTLVARLLLTPTSPARTRVSGMVFTYIVAWVASLAGLFYSLAGAHPGWAIGGYGLLVAAVNLVSLGRLGGDLRRVA